VALTLDGSGPLDIPPSAATFDSAPGAPTPDVDGPTAFERLARGLAAAVDRGDSLVDGASSGRFERMDAGTLIALQAGIYRYGEAVDLCAKLVDRAASATRTVLEAGR
jgi:hypothetical protein